MFYLFVQNNSNGEYIETEDIAKNVIIEAKNDCQAYKIAKKIGLFSLPFCNCCGPRFGINEYYSYDELQDARADCTNNHYNGTPSTRIHLK